MLNFLQRLFGADETKTDADDTPAAEGTTIFVVDQNGRIETSRAGAVHDIDAAANFAGEGALLSGSRGPDHSETQRVLQDDTRDHAA